MTCSKIFSGDLPELTYKIINFLQNDYSTLYSCILVNRLWCRLAIPLLWENPFSIYAKNHNYIEIYLLYINDDLKTKFYKYKVINNSLTSSTLFNYPSFLKYLNTYEFIFSIQRWFGSPIKKVDFENISYLIDYYVIIDICVSLFTIFIENEVTLHTLEIESASIIYEAIYPSNILELILQNTNFIHNIKNLKLQIIDNNKYITQIIDSISQIINLQQNLKKILINRAGFLLCQSLFLSKDYNCSNTLNTIVFYYCDFKGINNLKTVFEQLNVLESVHIFYCNSLNTEFTQQIINLTKPFKLKSLFISKVLEIKSLQQVLQKSGGYIENFGYGLDYDLSSNQQLLELIAKYCKNINFLNFNGLESEIVYQMFNLIENIKQNLNYLLIDIYKYNTSNSPDGNFEGSSIILQNLGQALPSKLEYISLALTIKESDFRLFLENSQDTFVNELLVIQKGSEDILHYIKEYIMKERRVKYLAVENTKNRINLFDLKDEVKEFKLHNIIVRHRNDLNISVNDYIKNID
ncbi:unnamed protein product [Rhizophagus irregularis]|nr:unnamed protein product [Rhizophagus irregularis]